MGGVSRSPDRSQPKIDDALTKSDTRTNSQKRTRQSSWTEERQTMTLDELARIMTQNHVSTTQQISALHSDVSDFKDQMQQQVSELRHTVEQQSVLIEELTKERDKLSDELRRRNLIIHGLPETEKTQEDLEVLISSILPPDLVGIKVQIDAPFRLGKHPVRGKCRPVKVHFPLLSHRLAVFKVRKSVKLPGSNVLVSEDLCPSTRAERKRRWIEKNPSPVMDQD